MHRTLIFFVCLSLMGCHRQADGPPKHRFWKHIIKAHPHPEKKSKYGNPKSYVVRGKRYYVMDSAHDFKQEGYASWYGRKFHGRLTSNRERYNLWAMTGAHKSLPLPTYVRVTNLKNHKKAIIRINDRGPFHSGRILDLSYGAARKLGISGTAKVRIEVIEFVKKHPLIRVALFRSLANAEKAKRDLSHYTDTARIEARLDEDHPHYIVTIHPKKVHHNFKKHLEHIYHVHIPQ